MGHKGRYIKYAVFIFGLLAAFVSAAYIARAEDTDARPGKREPARRPGPGLKRWGDLTPEERQEYRQRLEKWRQMPPEKKQRIRRNFEEYKRLTPEERKALREQWHKWRDMPADKKEAIKARYEKSRRPGSGPAERLGPGPERRGHRPHTEGPRHRR